MTQKINHTFTEVSSEQSEILTEIVHLHKKLVHTYGDHPLTKAELRQMYAASLGTATGFIYALLELGVVDIEPVKAAYLADLALNFDAATANVGKLNS